MKTKNTIIFSFALITAAAGLLVSVAMGAKALSLKQVFDAVFKFDGSLDSRLIRDLRLPRALCSLAVGGLLSMSGAMLQGVTRNELCEPSIMGITQGATLSVAIASVSISAYSLVGNMLAALIGALISGALVLCFSFFGKRKISVARLLIAGTLISTFFLSLSTVIALISGRSMELAFWLSGGLRNAGWIQLKLLIGVSLICFISAIILSGKINILSLGDDAAVGLGVSPHKLRLKVVALIAPMCAASVAVAGNIAFVGLIIPHIVRRLTSQDYKIVVPLSFIIGAALLVWADVLAKTINAPYETPIGLFSAIIGIPVFMVLVRRGKA